VEHRTTRRSLRQLCTFAHCPLNWFDRLDFWFPAYTTCGALIGLVIAALLGGFHAVVLVLALAALEFALSAGDGLDALSQLKERGPAWRERWMFGVPGLVIAVLGSRFLLPLAVIALVGATTPWQAVHLAFSSHDPYYRQIRTAGSGFALFAVGLLFVMAARIAIERNNEWRRIRAYRRSRRTAATCAGDTGAGCVMLGAADRIRFLRCRRRLRVATGGRRG